MLAIWAFDHKEKRHTSYRGKDCMKKFCESLRKHTKNIINYEKKKMLPFTKKELKSHHDAKLCCISRKRISNLSKSISYQKIRNPCHYTEKCRGVIHSIFNLKFSVPNEIPVVFHNSYNYDFHFIIRELTNEFEGKLECLEENSEKCNAFSIPIAKEVIKIDKDGNESVLTISYKIKFIDSSRFMVNSLSHLVDNLSE